MKFFPVIFHIYIYNVNLLLIQNNFFFIFEDFLKKRLKNLHFYKFIYFLLITVDKFGYTTRLTLFEIVSSNTVQNFK